MAKYLLILFFIFISYNVFSQNITADFYNSGAGLTKNGKASLNMVVGRLLQTNTKEKQNIIFDTELIQQSRTKPAPFKDNAISEGGIRIYPNPTKDIIYVSMAGDLTKKIEKVEIIDIIGNVLYTNLESEHIHSGTDKGIDLSGFKQGQYFVRLKFERNITKPVVFKIIKL